MTDDTNTPGTDLDLRIARKLSIGPGKLLSDVMSELFALRDRVAADVNTRVDLPLDAHVSALEIAAMETLHSLMEDPRLPDTAREASPEERGWMIAVRENATVVYKMAERIRDKQIKPAAHNHFDRVAEREGLVNEETIRNKEGHYVLPDDHSFRVVEEERTIHRVYRRGTASYGDTVISGNKLRELFENGEITWKQYLRWTQSTRVLREDRILEDGQKDPQIFAILARITTTTAPTVSIQAARNSDEESK